MVALILKELLSRERQRAGVFPKTVKHLIVAASLIHIQLSKNGSGRLTMG